MPKNVAILTPVIPPYVGGIGKAALDEAEILARNFEVTIFTPKYKYIDKAEEQRGRVKIKYIRPFFAFGNAAILAGIKKELQNFDIIYLHYPFFGTAELVCQMSNVKCQMSVVKCQMFIIRYHMDVVGRGLLKPLFWFHTKFAMPRILKKADKIIVSTLDYARNSNIKNLFKKHPEKFTEIPFSIDTEKFQPRSKDQKLLQKHSIGQNDKVLLFVGGLDRAHYFKGLSVLLRAMLNVKCQMSNVKLIVVGDGNLRSYYEALAKKLNASEVVYFVGRASNDDLPRYYNLVDVFVFPSIDRSEAFGIALLEAIASGKAVIASDLPGVRTLVKENINGFLVTPNDHEELKDKIQQVLQRVNEFGRASRELALEKYEKSRITSKLLTVFNRLIVYR